MSRIICVSSRVFPPDSICRNASTDCVRSILKQQNGGIWFGWDGRIVHSRGSAVAYNVQKNEQDSITYLTIPLLEQEHFFSYRKVSEGALWALMHHVPEQDNDKTLNSAFSTYRHVNYLYASHLHPLLQPDDIIWVHDSHLIPLGQALRDLGVENRILYFHHDPMPDAKRVKDSAVSQPLRRMYANLVKKLFAYDQVGFQSFRDLHNFMDYICYKGSMPKYFSAVTMAHNGAETLFGVFPASIATREVEIKAVTEPVTPATGEMLKTRGKRDLIAGIAAPEHTNGIINGIIGLARFLSEDSKQRENICYASLLPGTGQGALTETDYIAKAAADYIGKDILIPSGMMPATRVLSRLRHVRVGLVTPLVEGQNTLAKEFLAVQDPKDPGVLVLSQYAGAAEEMADHGILLVDPHDPADIASAIRKALEMDMMERMQRHARALAHMRAFDLAHWSHSFLRRIEMPPARPRQHTEMPVTGYAA